MPKALWKLLCILCAPDDGGAGGAGAGGAGGAGGGAGGAGAGGAGGGDAGGGNPFGKSGAGAGAGAGAQGGAGAGSGGGAAPYYPEGFPDHLKGTNERETIDKLYGAYSGARRDMSERGTVPKDANGYELTLSDTAKKVLGEDLSKDRSAQIYRTLAHKHGLTDKQASGFFAEFHDELLQAGVIKTIDPAAEARKILGNGAAGLSDDQVLDQAGERWQTVQDRIGGLLNNKTISQSEAEAAKVLTNTADGILFLEKLFARTGEHGLQPGGSQQGGGITKADLDNRINDPRSNPLHPKYDKAFADETDRLGRAFYSGKAA